MTLRDIIGIILIVTGTVGFGIMFIIVLRNAIAQKESTHKTPK